MQTNESDYLMPYNSRADVVRLWAEQYDTKFNVNLGWFRSQLQASYVSSHTVYIYIHIYIYIYILKEIGHINLNSVFEVFYFKYLGSKRILNSVMLLRRPNNI